LHYQKTILCTVVLITSAPAVKIVLVTVFGLRKKSFFIFIEPVFVCQDNQLLVRGVEDFSQPRPPAQDGKKSLKQHFYASHLICCVIDQSVSGSVVNPDPDPGRQ
jgi:hypothetical protein